MDFSFGLGRVEITVWLIDYFNISANDIELKSNSIKKIIYDNELDDRFEIIKWLCSKYNQPILLEYISNPQIINPKSIETHLFLCPLCRQHVSKIIALYALDECRICYSHGKHMIATNYGHILCKECSNEMTIK